jgi:hypothetical protein
MTSFPFSRAVWYTFSEFVEFEQHLSAARRADSKLDADLRLNRQPWIKIRNEELYPAWHFCKHCNLLPATEFRIGLVGADADIEIRMAGCIQRLQMTTAGPLWPGGTTQWGVDHMLHMQQLNQKGQSSGWGPYRKQPDGSITNRDNAISSDERDPAYLAGIRQALIGKRLNQHADCELIVYAGGYNEVMNHNTFRKIAGDALRKVPLPDFAAVHILAGGEGFIVSSGK